MGGIAEALRGGLAPRRPDPPLPGGTPAGVIVPLIDVPDPLLLLTRRSELVRDHKGEISFPGGARHGEDADLLATALRETEEELGVPAAAFEVLGALPPVHTFVSGYVIRPFVGLLAGRPVLAPSGEEIAEVLEIPVARLLDVEREVEAPGGMHATMYVYDVAGTVVWGATGRVLHELLEVLRKSGWR